MINRAVLAKQLLPGLNKIFGLEYGTVENEHTPLFDMDNSVRAFEEELLMTGFATAPTKAEGAAVDYDDAKEMWNSRYTHETIALAYALTEEAMEDNLYDTVSKIKTKGLARAMANTKQIKAANIFNNGFNAAFVGGDNVSLFSSTHPTVSAGNLSNSTNTDLAEAALENAIIAVNLFVDDRGILLGSTPMSLHVPPQLTFTAERLLNTPGRTATPNNDINATRSMGLIPKGWFVNKRFTDTNAWFLRTDCPNGAKMFTRVGLQTKMEPDFDTGNLRFKARERYSFGWSDWRAVYGSSGST